MKRRIIYTVLLVVLVIFLVTLAASAGIADEKPTPVITGDSEYTGHLAKTDLWIYEEPYSTGFCEGEVSLENYDALYEAYGGRPSWSAVNLNNGDEVDISIRDRGRSASFSDYYQPEEAGDVTYEITCAWRTSSSVFRVVFHFVDGDLPVGTNIPDIIDLQVGTLHTLSCAFLPNGWGAGRDTVFTEFRQWEYPEHVDWEYVNGGTELLLTPEIPGYSSVDITISNGNISWSKRVGLRIADAEGNIPELKMELYSAVPERSERDRWSVNDTFIRVADDFDESDYGNDYHDYTHHHSYGIDNYESISYTCKALYGDEPVWTVSHDGGSALALSLEGYEGRRDYRHTLSIDRWPDRDMDVTVTITCKWGELESSIVKTYHFSTVRLMDIEITERINIDAGATIQLTCDDLGKFIFSDGSQKSAAFFGISYWDDDDENPLEIRVIDDEAHRDEYLFTSDAVIGLTAERAGYDLIRITIAYQDHSVQSYGALLCVNAPGQTPILPEIKIPYDETEETIAIAPLGERINAPYSRGTIDLYNFRIENYDLLKAVNGGEPVWTIEQLSGAPFRGEVFMEKEKYATTPVLRIHQMPDRATTAELKLTCTWGNSTATRDCTVNFIESDLPQGIAGPEVVSLMIDEESIFDEYRFLPLDDDFNCYFSGIYPEREDIVEELKSFGIYVKAIGTGYTEAIIEMSASDGICYRVPVTIRVTDVNGIVPGLSELNLPAALRRIDESAFQGMAAERVVIPSGCRTIADGAFRNCDHLLEVVLPEDIQSIAPDAFGNHPPVFIVPKGSGAEDIVKDNGWRYAAF